jgi:hypothetical protein
MGWLEDLLKEYPELASAKYKLIVVNEKLKHLEKEVKLLREKIAEVTTENTALREHPVLVLESGLYVKERGVLWKRTQSGTFEDVPFCPTCIFPLLSFPPGSDDMLTCPKCNFLALFRPSKSHKILATLNKTFAAKRY